MKKFDFVANFKKCLILSLVVILLGATVNLFTGTKMDISFKGGTELCYSYEKDLNAKEQDALKEALTKLGKKHLGDGATVTMDKKSFSEEDGSVVTKDVVTFQLADAIKPEQSSDLYAAMKKAYKDYKFVDAGSNTLAPAMGQKFLLRCLLAVGLAAILLVVYVSIRFRNIGGFPAAIAALIALAHDLLIVYFTFVIFGIELNDNFVAVMLTILGYSLNDTIVIFDRIRTNRRRSDAPLTEIVNDSLHAVKRRTIITTATTCVAILAVLIVAMVMHVDSIISFALPMLLGSISGSYSSLFLSGPIWVRWMNAREKKAAKKSK